jgi:glycerol transport system substrate-binding protein
MKVRYSRYSVLAIAAACAAAGPGWAGEAEAKKWIDNEFQPSTCPRTSSRRR